MAKMRLAVTLIQLGHKPTNTLRVSADLTDVSNLSLSAVFGNRHGGRSLATSNRKPLSTSPRFVFLR